MPDGHLQPELPDLAHICHLREALWRGRAHGHAAVMVGSGFSRNAHPIGPTVPPFPTWQELSLRLSEALQPAPAPMHDTRALRTSPTAGMLRLAEEYEAAFGRDALDTFLLDTIPDNDYQPSALHELLLRLPWSDVFTTNYDTLLERTSVVGRNYDVVRTPQDIPRATKPRIVKLHGTFTSTRPFIITEEDFRTYPRRFAAFVNLAQQAIMENVLCLLGFSGDDPNFLYWTGWVRDNLGPAAPRIYICGLLGWGIAQRGVLQRRNVAPVDLSPLFPSDAWPDEAARQAAAFEWLLLTLAAGEPPNPLAWPDVGRAASGAASQSLPAIPRPAHRRSREEPLWPRNE